MARLAVLTDRSPDDPDWKGAYAWEIIRALAESQHEVAVFTTIAPETIGITHPRLTVARPAPSWALSGVTGWAAALLNFRPEIIHSFALTRAPIWPALTVWPYLEAIVRVLPGVMRVSTCFEAEDFAAVPWRSDRWTVFDSGTAPEGKSSRVDVLPLEIWPAWSEAGVSATEENGIGPADTLVPAPVSEWNEPERQFALLTDHLIRHPGATVHINGGWGSLPLSDRRRAWRSLAAVAARIRLLEPMPLGRFVDGVRSAERLWLDELRPGSWRFLLSAHLARAFNKELIGPARAPGSESGSAANSLSRLYLA